MKYFLATIIGLLACYMSPASAYVCTTNTANTTLTIPPLIIQRDAAVGSVIGSVMTGTVTTYTCTSGGAAGAAAAGQITGLRAVGTYVGNFAGVEVFSTNIPGIGYAVGGAGVNTCGSTFVTGAFLVGNTPNTHSVCSNSGQWSTLTMTGTVEFIKTAATTGSGVLSAMQVGSFILYNGGSTFQTPESLISISSVPVTTVACSVNNANIRVTMGTINSTAFSGVGSSPAAARTQNFTIPLSCNLGTRVNVTLTGTAVSGTTGVVALDSAGTTGVASGVGVQMLYNSVPVTLGSIMNIGTATSEGNFNIPLQARYYQTASTITAGTANSSATFTLAYQ